MNWNAAPPACPGHDPGASTTSHLIRTMPLLLVYGLAFNLLHHLAAFWGTQAMFSLWFPAAGLRFALLWWMGPVVAPLAALSELGWAWAMGSKHFPPLLSDSVEAVLPCLLYGAVIHLVRRFAFRPQTITASESLQFTFSALGCATLSCLGAIPWTMLDEMAHNAESARHIVSAYFIFIIGDLLGILTIAPPLLLLARWRKEGFIFRHHSDRNQHWREFLVIALLSWTLVALLHWAGIEVSLLPAVLAISWVGLRGGWASAFAFILLAAVIVMPVSASMSDEDMLVTHALLACMAGVGIVAGSFSEAQAELRAQIARRDRMLFQAERLKALRAMSVAVIHEVSQPLSTIAIEARHLATTASAGGDPEDISRTAEMIARKSKDLADLVRRLRRFGDRSVDAHSLVPLSQLMGDVIAIATPEARVAGIQMDVGPEAQAAVRGNAIELQQALLNLVRNAIAASPPDTPIQLESRLLGDKAQILVSNQTEANAARRRGMGVGLMIARTIAEAHGGQIREERPDPLSVQFTLELPAGAMND